MNINPSYSTLYANAYRGIQRGMQGMDKNAAQLANPVQLQGGADPTQPLVANQMDSIAVRANAKVLATADDTLGTLLDVIA